MSARLPLKPLRTLAGLTIDQVAAEANTSAGYISRVENGERKPSPRWIGRVTSVIALHLKEAA